MSEIEEMIQQRIKQDPNFVHYLRQFEFDTATAFAVDDLRHQLNLNRPDFAKKIKVPKRVLLKLESGDMEITPRLLNQIATRTGRKIRLNFIDAEKGKENANESAHSKNQPESHG
ncbi:hypothetical protein AYR62_09735 [Secundilactobacillus paracollinoides]|uniref:HTH cro/C1-type domain-containing protein n=1 Tax=Secundilactobacillus paracollinoides TaxID=240427 RepID=A0A1B2IYS6_9LACO|nr:helix-turn-helix transcriptional regulator [Secundilactobacillus paracollinoides]ANZ61279.1 hypothetical protein AYR61_07890 [Secundilactobacillus paracollinoides]ANZ64329.1 hypothetical protein AYR62_09735 [Secundilactobacillus paracollinoides]ANZ67201.1 hypothetical protein AYR63_08640 [Secundilactobacillus paracollinoides]